MKVSLSKIFWGGVAGLLASTSFAVDFNLFGAPSYFSGTNCRAFGGASINKLALEEEIVAMHLRIGTGSDYAEIPGTFKEDRSGLHQVADAEAVFDSTHFADGTTVEIRVYAKAKYLNGSIDEDWQISEPVTATVKNKSIVLGSTFEKFSAPLPYAFGEGPVQLVPNDEFKFAMRQNLEQGKYTLHWSPNGLWTIAELLVKVAPCNVLATLGNGDELAAGIWDNQGGSTNTSALIPPSSVSMPKIADVGIDVPPPCNVSGNPPFNFALLMACHQGNFGAWGTILNPT